MNTIVILNRLRPPGAFRVTATPSRQNSVRNEAAKSAVFAAATCLISQRQLATCINASREGFGPANQP
jgi:hypothetical protein